MRERARSQSRGSSSKSRQTLAPLEERVERARAQVAAMPKGQEASLLAGLVDLLASPRRSTGRKGATRHRLNYDSLEIELLYRMWQSEENAARLARLLERTKDAIEYVWRWCDGANFPPEAGNDIIRKVREVERRLGRRLRGQWSTLPAPLAELLRKASREAHPGG